MAEAGGHGRPPPGAAAVLGSLLFVTAACNFRCPFCCYADNLNQGGDLSLDQMKAIARTSGRFRNLLVSGGEPFLRKHLAEIFREFRRHCGIEIIEIPTNERNKYELDKTLGIYRLDRVLHSAVHYPGDYGFLPRTLGEDGDPLDVLVLMTIPVFTGCLVDVRPVGLFHLLDRGVADEKVLAVPLGDPYSEGLTDLEDIPAHYLKEIEHFFQVYKDLEGEKVSTEGFEDRASAERVIAEARARANEG